jgi:cytochrome c1
MGTTTTSGIDYHDYLSPSKEDQDFLDESAQRMTMGLAMVIYLVLLLLLIGLYT